MVETSFKKLEDYCNEENFKGYDPFDGLNSKLFIFFKLNKVPFFHKLSMLVDFKCLLLWKVGRLT